MGIGIGVCRSGQLDFQWYYRAKQNSWAAIWWVKKMCEKLLQKQGSNTTYAEPATFMEFLQLVTQVI